METIANGNTASFRLHSSVAFAFVISLFQTRSSELRPGPVSAPPAEREGGRRGASLGAVTSRTPALRSSPWRAGALTVDRSLVWFPVHPPTATL